MPLTETPVTRYAVRVKLKLILFVVLGVSPTVGAECRPVTLSSGEALDHECHRVRIERAAGEVYIVSGTHRERVDCTRAVRDPVGGWRDYQARTASIRVQCPGNDRRKGTGASGGHQNDDPPQMRVRSHP